MSNNEPQVNLPPYQPQAQNNYPPQPQNFQPQQGGYPPQMPPQGYYTQPTGYAPQMPLQPPVKASGRVSLLAIVLMIVATLVGAIVIGAIVAYVSKLVYLIIAFPIFMGLIGGLILMGAIRVGKMRSTTLAVIFAIIMGVLIYGAYSYVEYLIFRDDFNKALIQRGSNFSQSEADKLFDLALQQEVGSTGFIGFIKEEAKEGIRITRASSAVTNSSGGLVLKDGLTYAYFVVEIMIICGMVALVAVGAAKKGYCDNCQRWFASTKSLGKAEPAAEQYLVGLLKNQNYGGAGEVVSPSYVSPSHVEVKVESCATCQINNSNLTVKRVKMVRRNKQSKDVLQQSITPQQYAEFIQGQRNRALMMNSYQQQPQQG